ncbi:MAG: HWE histidine kinase domain-containing protein [Myxococcota bacterium]
MPMTPDDRLRAEREAMENCENEPIQFIGTIQPQGYLCALALDEPLTITHLSANLPERLGRSRIQLLGQPASLILSTSLIHALRNAAGHPSFADQRELIGESQLGEQTVDVFAYRGPDQLVVEMLVREESQSLPADALRFATKVQAELQRFTEVGPLLEWACLQVRALTRYDRVKAYKFLPDKSGEVVAESRAGGVDSYLGLRFPAYDIPQNARTLYAKTPIRVISGVEQTQVEIHGTERLDLSLSLLRGVNDVHALYLRNMGVGASMSIPIAVGGELWGLLALHHLTPRMPTVAVAVACELFGRSLSLALQQIISRNLVERREQALRTALNLFVPDESPLGYAAYWDLTKEALFDLVRADGVALVTGERVARHGQCPPDSTIRALVQLTIDDERASSSPTAHESLPALLPDADFETSAGAMIVPTPLPSVEAVVFFRNELRRTVRWAGAPDKPLEDTARGFRLNPRASFAEYVQSVEHRSDEWLPDDLMVGEVIQEATLRIRDAAAAQARHRDNLGLVVRELNHRVRNILALVQSLVQQSVTESTTVDSYVSALDHRISALAHAHRLLTRTEWKPIDCETLLREVLAAYAERVDFDGPPIEIPPQFASVLSLVVHELSSNAGKYGAFSLAGGRVHFSWRSNQHHLIFEWKEKSGPAVSPPEREGFGSSIIREAMPFEFDATVELSYPADGLLARFVVPEAVIGEVSARESDAAVASPSAEPHLRRALVVEDDFFVGRTTADILRSLGATAVTVMPTVERALQHVATHGLEFAVLDANLRGAFSGPVANALAQREVPFVFVTGYGSSHPELENFPSLGVLTKPIERGELGGYVNQLGWPPPPEKGP